MPLQFFFEEQIRLLRVFLNAPGEKLRILLTDPDTKVISHKLLAGLDKDDAVTAVIIPTDAAFLSAPAFFERVYEDLVESYNLFAEELEAVYILPPPEWKSLKYADPAERFARGVAMFANSLPEEVGAIAFIIDPAKVTDPAGYRKALKSIAENTPSDWVKYVVLDDRIERHTAELADDLPDVKVQSLYLPPAELEKRVKWHLATGVAVGPVEKRIYTGLLASFALSRKEHEEALRLSQEQLKLTEPHGTPNDLSAVHYNIGNVHLAKDDHAAAAESFTTALELAMKVGLSAIVPSILCNLGVALFHGGAPEQSDECFATSRVYCQMLNLRPTEAHVLDCMARCHTVANRPHEAEKCWNEALAKYDEITAPQMQFARDGGRTLILMMLQQHYQGTKQLDKLTAIRGSSLVAIPDKILEKSGETIGTATQNGASLTQDPNAHWYDVMTNTGAGMADHVSSGDAQYIATHAVPGAAIVDSSVRIAQSLGRDWNSADFDGVKEGMSQQASVIADQAAAIWDGKSPEGKPLTTFQRVGAAFGLLSSVEQLISMPLSMIPFPALPALRILDTDIGLPHAHMHPPNLTPPNPVPVPLPSTGPVIPIPILSGASKVLINGMPAARCGDMGLGVWCGGYFPMYEVFLGSSNVWIEGNRAARVGTDITKHCIFTAPKPSDPPVGPMFGTTISCSPNVNIGGIPLPSLTSMAMGAAFKALFKGVGKVIGAVRKRIGKSKTRLTSSEGTRVIDPSTKLSSTAEDLLSKMPNPKDAVVVDKVAVKDLADLTRKTGDEFAVVLRDGKVTVIRGREGSVTMRDSDKLLAHTHPHGPEYFPRDIGHQGPDKSLAEGSDLATKKAEKTPHPEAVIYTNGDTSFYDDLGPIHGSPPKGHSPVSPDGFIDGKQH